jgi:hypothetical protein
MKNHKNLIRLIIVTAALVAIGVFAFKYMRTYDSLSERYQTQQVQVEQADQAQDDILQGNNSDASDDVVIQKRAASSSSAATSSCAGPNAACSSTTKCCSGTVCTTSCTSSSETNCHSTCVTKS